MTIKVGIINRQAAVAISVKSPSAPALPDHGHGRPFHAGKLVFQPVSRSCAWFYILNIILLPVHPPSASTRRMTRGA